MNKTRRKALNALQDRLTAAKANVETLHTEMREIHDALEALRDEEQESFDNLSEGAQEGERGQTMEQAVSDMDEALQTLDAMADALSVDEVDSAFEKMEDAKGPAD